MTHRTGTSAEHDAHEHHHEHPHDHHHHDHDHHHGDGFRGRVRHVLGDLFGTHSHDSVEQVDEALEANDRGRRALWISLGVLSLTAALQAVVAALSGSVALLGDTLHNVVDAATALPILVAFGLARRPPNRRFTYGYGRAEDLAGLVVVATIALSSVTAAVVAIDRLLHPHSVSALWAVAAAGLAGFLGNETVARYRIRVGREIGSAALVADGLHARTDGFTSLAVVVGAAGVALGASWADPVIGLLIAVAIVGVLRSAAAQVGARLMDAVDPELVDGVTGLTALRLRWSGHALFAEAAVTVPAGLSVVAGDAIATHAREHLAERLPRLAAATIQVGPDGTDRRA